MTYRSGLPIDPALPALLDALRTSKRAVLMAPPGAGKTSVVPLALDKAGLSPGRILMLEPRRLAARASAERMAATLGEKPGETVGYRIRGEAKTSKRTRIEVVTEGILTRRLQSDPALEGIGAVIFDEFHERSLNADLGLALIWEVVNALRDDLLLVVMSATLDADPVARLLDDAPVIRAEGRAFPVETRWLDQPRRKGARLEEDTAALILKSLSETTGGVLTFLPGEGEIRRVETLLKPKLPTGCSLHPLYGALPFSAQRAAIEPAPSGRKIVLATSIAETSLTIEDVRVVIDAGRARRARFDPGNGMSRLVTEPVSRAEAEQRRGRAGRVAEGICYRLWSKGEEGGLPPFPPAEIEAADLTGLTLDLALWGTPQGEGLAFLTPPHPGVMNEARSLLTGLGALAPDGAITTHGKAMASLPVHPRLAHMLLQTGPDGAALAALLEDRDILPRGAPCDLSLRLSALKDPKAFAARHPWQPNRGGIDRMRKEARRLEQLAGKPSGLTSAQAAALAYPDRVGLRRKGDAPRYVLSGGHGVEMSPEDPLAATRLIVVTATDGARRDARIRQAIAISEAELREVHGEAITWHDACAWSRREGRVVARRQERFGAIVLDDRHWRDAPDEAIATAMLDGVRELGLRPDESAMRFLARVSLAREAGHDLPDLSEDALMTRLETWLLPYLDGVKTAGDWKRFDLKPALRACLDWNQTQELDRITPQHVSTPLGRKIEVDYSGEHPAISVRLQEMFGTTTHPRVAGKPLRVTLLSPAQRPVQTTMDLPAFWDSSYADVRKDMRGRYPKHPWPENPREADPTLRAKPRR